MSEERLIDRIRGAEVKALFPYAVLLTPGAMAQLREEYSEETGIDYVIEHDMTRFYELIIAITFDKEAPEFVIVQQS